jgi:hypothetical protein
MLDLHLVKQLRELNKKKRELLLKQHKEVIDSKYENKKFHLTKIIKFAKTNKDVFTFE